MATPAGAPLPGSIVEPSSSLHASAGVRAAMALLFVLAIALPLAVNVTGRDGADVVSENRDLAAFPQLTRSLKSWADYPNGFGHWFEDHFGLRAALVRWDAALKLFVLHVSPSDSVIVGRDGWYFYADDGAVEDYTGESPMPAELVNAWRETITRADRFVTAGGGAYLFVIAPDKHVIYPEEMPGTIRRVRDLRRMDQVFEALAPAGVTAVDVRPALLGDKAHERIYEKTDTHWNDRGALVAYQQIIGALRKHRPDIPPAWGATDFAPVERLVAGQDLARMMGLTRMLHETDLTWRPLRPRRSQVVEPAGAEPTAEEGTVITEIPGSSLPRAVIFRDSFTSRLVPFLSEHFSRAVYLWQNDFDPDVVRREHPDVVIQEIVGRHLYNFIPSPELIPQERESR